MLCRYISYYDPPPWITFFSLHDIKDIYRRYFLRNIQRDIFYLLLDMLNILKILKISLADYKEEIGNYTKYLEKKNITEWVCKYLKITWRFRKSDMKLQKFRMWIWLVRNFCIWNCWCENFRIWLLLVRNFRIRERWCEIFASENRWCEIFTSAWCSCLLDEIE